VAPHIGTHPPPRRADRARPTTLTPSSTNLCSTAACVVVRGPAGRRATVPGRGNVAGPTAAIDHLPAIAPPHTRRRMHTRLLGTIDSCSSPALPVEDNAPVPPSTAHRDLAADGPSIPALQLPEGVRCCNDRWNPSVQHHHFQFGVIGLPQIVRMPGFPAQHQLVGVPVHRPVMVRQGQQPAVQTGDDLPDDGVRRRLPAPARRRS